MNEQITAPRARLIGVEKEPLGIVTIAEAMRLLMPICSSNESASSALVNVLVIIFLLLHSQLRTVLLHGLHQQHDAGFYF